MSETPCQQNSTFYIEDKVFNLNTKTAIEAFQKSSVELWSCTRDDIHSAITSRASRTITDENSRNAGATLVKTKGGVVRADSIGTKPFHLATQGR
jgi:hypothetical protein